MSENVRRLGGLAVELVIKGGEIRVGILGWALAVGGVLVMAAGMVALLAGRLRSRRLLLPKQALACLVSGSAGLVVGVALLSATVPAFDQQLDFAVPPLAMTDSALRSEEQHSAQALEEISPEGGGVVVAAGVTMETPRVLSSDLYPCSECHTGDGGADFLDRDVDFHTDKVISGHGEPLKWCFDCHNPDSPNTLRLVGGEAIDFERAHLLCGQCHGKIHAAWEAGAYGKRMGFWDGEKRLFSCAECHDPHQPRFAAITPDPAPTRPADTLR
jgi:hypothetical protein